MKKIPKKNYFILVILILITTLLTLFFARMYNNRYKIVSNFYNYANKITSDEFDEYMLENSDLIIYISDKYDLTNELFENKFQEKIDSLNLKGELIYIDKEELNKKFLKKLREEYAIKVDKDKLPVIILMIDKKIVKKAYITSSTNVDTVIKYEVFE